VHARSFFRRLRREARARGLRNPRWPPAGIVTSEDVFKTRPPSPHPGGFWQRVRNRLKIKELSFARVQKNAQECERKGDRSKTRWNAALSVPKVGKTDARGVGSVGKHWV